MRWQVLSRFLAAAALAALLMTTTGGADRVGGSAAPGPAGIDTHGPPHDLVGIVDLVGGRRNPGAAGWVATSASRVPRIEVVVDGALVARLRPDIRRYDVEAAQRGATSVAGFRVALDEVPSESLCLHARVDGGRVGVDCVIFDTDAFIAGFGRSEVFGTAGRVTRYSVEVEAATGLLAEDVTDIVDAVLSDERSWIGDGRHRLRRVPPQRADLRIILARPATVDALCVPFRTVGYLSCQRDDLMMLNIERWNDAVPHWTATLDDYRAYLVNHEMGHFLGFTHVDCPRPGRRAPVMQQQTKTLAGCRPNGWPNP